MFLADRSIIELSFFGGVHALLATVVFLPGTPLDTLRPVAAFSYLLLVPGLLLVNVFRIYQEDPLAQLVTASGLSLIYVMVLGLVLSGIPATIVERPLAAEVFMPVSLAITMTLALTGPPRRSILGPLASVAKIRYLGWALLPFAAVFVALHVQAGGSTLWMVILLGAVSATPLLLLVRRPTATECVVAIFSIALALAFHKYFVAPELPGWDVRLEGFFAAQALEAGRWSPRSENIYQAMLSITVLPAAVSEAVGLELITASKIFFGVILAFIPVTIFLIGRNLFGTRWALVGAFIYLGHYVFPLVMINVRRQSVATLLVCLLILTITINQQVSIRVRVLQLVLVLGVVFSHYSMVPVLVVALAASLLLGPIIQRRIPSVRRRLIGLPPVGLIVIMVAFAFLWFTWASRGELFAAFVSTGGRIFDAIGDTHFLNRQSADVVTGFFPTGFSYDLLLLANIGIVASGLLGFAVCLHGIARKDDFNAYLAVLGVGGILLGAIFLLVPQTSESFAISRSFLMVLLWLLPLSIYGLIWISRATVFRKNHVATVIAALGGLGLSVYIGLGTGLVTHLAGDDDFSYALDSTLIFNVHDEAALGFVSSNGSKETLIYADRQGQQLFLSTNPSHARRLSIDSFPLRQPEPIFLYLRKANLAGEWRKPAFQFISAKGVDDPEPEILRFVASLTTEMNLVYATGAAELYFSTDALHSLQAKAVP